MLARRADALASIRRTNRSTVLLHYANYGYQRRGCPAWLVEGLAALARRCDGRPAGHLVPRGLGHRPAVAELVLALRRSSGGSRPRWPGAAPAWSPACALYAGLLRPWAGARRSR